MTTVSFAVCAPENPPASIAVPPADSLMIKLPFVVPTKLVADVTESYMAEISSPSSYASRFLTEFELRSLASTRFLSPLYVDFSSLFPAALGQHVPEEDDLFFRYPSSICMLVTASAVDAFAIN